VLRRIIDGAGGSWVLLDEIGSGTDPAEAAPWRPPREDADSGGRADYGAGRDASLVALKQLAAETVGIRECVAAIRCRNTLTPHTAC